MVTINLLPIKAELRQKALIQHLVAMAACMIGLVCLLWVVQGTVSMSKEGLKQDIVNTKLEIQKLNIKAGEIQDFKKRKQELERKLDIIKDLNAKKSGPVQMLDEISLIIPEKAWLKSINNSDNKLVLDGVAIDNTVIAEFMKKLQGSQYFSDIELVLAEQEGINHRFTIRCNLKSPA